MYRHWWAFVITVSVERPFGDRFAHPDGPQSRHHGIVFVKKAVVAVHKMTGAVLQPQNLRSSVQMFAVSWGENAEHNFPSNSLLGNRSVSNFNKLSSAHSEQSGDKS